MLTEFGLPKNILSDVGRNFISDKFRQFCRQLNIEKTATSSYHHQGNGQVEACINFVKHTITNPLILMMMLSPVTPSFNNPINRETIKSNADSEHYKTLNTCQDKYIKGSDTCKSLLSFPIGFAIAIQHGDSGP